MKYIVGIIFSLLSFGGTAATWHDGFIQRIYPLADGNFVITFKNPPESCIRADKYFFVNVGSNEMTIEGANKIYSLAITSATTGKKLSVNFDETVGDCAVNRAYMSF